MPPADDFCEHAQSTPHARLDFPPLPQKAVGPAGYASVTVAREEQRKQGRTGPVMPRRRLSCRRGTNTLEFWPGGAGLLVRPGVTAVRELLTWATTEQRMSVFHEYVERVETRTHQQVLPSNTN